MMPSWGGADVGWMPWPSRFVTDERGIAIEPNWSTHHHGGRPMA